MIYLSSDWHLEPDTIKSITDMLSGLGSADTVLMLGDLSNDWRITAGRPWFLDALEELACRILFLDGNHDDMNYLDGLPEEEQSKAACHRIGRNLFHVCRGEALCLEGKTFLALGGGYSGAGYISRHPDRWQPREMPSAGELDHGLETCVRHDFSFDYIVSHAAPLSVIRHQRLGEEYNSLHAYLDGIAACVSRRQWYFGHYHKTGSWDGGFELIDRGLFRLPDEHGVERT